MVYTPVVNWGAYINIELLTSLFKGFIGSEEIVYKHKQEVGMYGFFMAWILCVAIMHLATDVRVDESAADATVAVIWLMW
jgi:hypothetical protein